MSEKKAKDFRKQMGIGPKPPIDQSLRITLIVEKDGRFRIEQNRSMTIDQLRSLMLEGIISTIIDQSVEATKAVMKSEASKLILPLGLKL